MTNEYDVECDMCHKSFDINTNDYYAGPKDPHDMSCNPFQDFMTVCEACLEEKYRGEVK